MYKLMDDIVQAFAQAWYERSILYKLESINIAKNKFDTTISYEVFGTGKNPLDKKLLDVYHSKMLYQFRQEDIKTLSTTAVLLSNDLINKHLVTLDLLSQDSPTATFSTQNNQLYKYKLSDIAKNPKLLLELGVDGYSGYLLASFVNEFTK